MMITGTLLAGMVLQEPGTLSSGNTQLLTIFVGIAAVSLLMLGTAFVVMAVTAVKLQKKVAGVIDDVKVKALPALVSTDTILRDLAPVLRELTPKVKVLTENLTVASDVVRAKLQEFDSTLTGVNETIRDANQKTKVQVGRVDSIVTTTLARTAALADTIHTGIRKPVNEVAGVVNGFKAGLDVLMSKTKDFGVYRRPRP